MKMQHVDGRAKTSKATRLKHQLMRFLKIHIQLTYDSIILMMTC